MLPMGELSVANNTFWQLLHAVPGSSRWTVVTPTGDADNGGLVAGAAGDSVVAGCCPSQLLRFSPLSSSIDGGATWTPRLFRPRCKPRPMRSLLAPAGNVVAAIAVMVGGTVLPRRRACRTGPLLVTAPRLGRASLRCGVTPIDAVPSCPRCAAGGHGVRRGGVLSASSPRRVGPGAPTARVLGGLARSATDVLRLETSGPTVHCAGAHFEQR